MVIAKRSREPVYKRLKDTIIREIENGTLRENDPILSERLLTEKFGISRISVRKALRELIDDGHLYTVPGKGTFVKGLTGGLQKPLKATYNLGFVFWYAERGIVSIPYFAHFVTGAERISRRNDYHLIISTFPEGDQLPNSLPSIIEQGKVDGVLLEGVDLETYSKVNKFIPAVIISNFLYQERSGEEELGNVDYVAANNEEAMLKVLGYLKKLGHRQVGFILQDPRHSTFRERLYGFHLGIRLYKLKTREDWIVTAQDGAEGIKQIFALKQRPTAIVAGNDKFALDVIEYCQQRGIEIPREFSLVGFDDIESSCWSTPPLTTVRVLTEEMGEQAAWRLIEKIKNPELKSSRILIGTELIVRESCRPLKP